MDAERSQLPAKLRADRTCGACNQDRLVFEIGDDLIHRDADLGTTQQVLDLDLSDRLLHDLAVDNLVDRRRDQDLNALFRTIPDQAFLFRLGVVVRGEKNAVDVVTVPEVFDAAFVFEVVNRSVFRKNVSYTRPS